VDAAKGSAAGCAGHAGRGVLAALGCAALNGGRRVWRQFVNGALYVPYLTAVLV
jgi:hypothetical protein